MMSVQHGKAKAFRYQHLDEVHSLDHYAHHCTCTINVMGYCGCSEYLALAQRHH